MASRSVKPCPIMEGNNACGETETLAIINEFKTLYESKMTKIDSAAGGDNLPVLQAKVHLQKQWIRDLTAQNELLVRAVEELEKEATDKVILLEEKLRSAAMQGANVASDSTKGFPCQQRQNLQGQNLQGQNLQGQELPVNTAEMQEKEEALEILSKQLQDKTAEVETVRRSLLDMRSALTIEVAEKHDVILSLRRDVQEFEDKCLQSNKQTQFRDDIIKELRKEIKSLKEEECEEQKDELLLKIKELQDRLKTLKSMEVQRDCNYIKTNINKTEEENRALKDEIARLKEQIAKLQGTTKEISSQRDNYRRQSEDASKKITAMKETAVKEKANLKQENDNKSKELEKTRRASEALAVDLGKVKTVAQEKSTAADNLKSDLESERNEHKKQSDQITSLSAENQKQHDKIQELYDQIKRLEEIAGTVYCHCDDSDSAPTETKHVSINTDEFRKNAATAQSTTSTSATDTWRTTDSESPGDQEEEMEEIRTLTVIKTTECTITSIGENRVVELEEQLARAMRESDIERRKHCQEMCNLKQTIMQLERCKGPAVSHVESSTVELYKNSITLLEASEERAKVEISQQRQTILNLQEALVASKHQIEELQQKSSNEVSFGWPIRWFGSSSTDSKLSSDDKDCVHDI